MAGCALVRRLGYPALIRTPVGFRGAESFPHFTPHSRAPASASASTFFAPPQSPPTAKARKLSASLSPRRSRCVGEGENEKRRGGTSSRELWTGGRSILKGRVINDMLYDVFVFVLFCFGGKG
jgi:hypothetical protein